MLPCSHVIICPWSYRIPINNPAVCSRRCNEHIAASNTLTSGGQILGWQPSNRSRNVHPCNWCSVVLRIGNNINEQLILTVYGAMWLVERNPGNITSRIRPHSVEIIYIMCNITRITSDNWQVKWLMKCALYQRPWPDGQWFFTLAYCNFTDALDRLVIIEYHIRTYILKQQPVWLYGMTIINTMGIILNFSSGTDQQGFFALLPLHWCKTKS